MKRFLSIFVCLMVAITSWAETSTYTDKSGVVWTNVSTASEFYSAIRTKDTNGNYNANVRLTADIDLTSLSTDDDYLFEFTFSGKITGSHGNKEIYRLSNFKKTLFEKLQNAHIKNIGLISMSYDGNDTESGQLTDEAVSTTVDSCLFAGVTGTGDSNITDCDRMGVVAGKAVGCTLTNLVFVDCTISTDGSYAGIVAGDAKSCTFTNIMVNAACNVWADGNITSYNSAYAGGVCGYADACHFTNCNNLAMVASDDDRVGGIIGYGTQTTTLTNCNNYGVIKHCTDSEFGRAKKLKNTKITAIAAGSIEGVSFITLTVVATLVNNFSALGGFIFGVFGINCLVVAPITLAVCAGVAIYYGLSSPDELGGIAGTLAGGSVVTGCTNYGPVECKNSYCGGIVGYLDNSTVESCCNRGFVKGNTNTGGIVGYCDEGTVRYCLNVGSASADGSRLGNIIGTQDGTCTIANNYYLSDTNTTEGPNYAFTQEKLPSGAIALTLNTANGEGIWRQTLGTDFYPVLDDTSKPVVTATTDTYSLVQNVSTSMDFFLAAANPFSQINITSDLDLGNYYFNLASTAHPFKGIVKGNGHTLSNVNYQAEESDADKENTALFPVVNGATFENFTLDGINITHTDEVAGSIHTEAILAATSTNSKYTNITIKNSSILRNSDPDYLAEVGGLVAISSGDEITGCTVESTCKFEGYSGWKNTDTNVGGIVSKAYNTTIKQCVNSAEIWADDNQEGGIAAYAEDCTIADCLNTGTITAQENVGGICGNAVNTVITRCVNTGVINDDDNTREDKRSGIVGVLNGSNASVSYCLNFGSVNYADDDCSPINNKRLNGASYGAGNYFYCQFNGKHQDELPSGITWADVVSGKFAMTATYLDATDNTNKKYLYQTIDNSVTFPTTMPVPLSKAGTVYSNILCDGTQSYSNSYQSTASHTSVDENSNGTCDVCGDYTILSTNIYIRNGVDLNNFARFVNSGKDYSYPYIFIDTDIDMSGFAFTPIGNVAHPFTGKVVAAGNRIKNLTITGKNNVGNGLFGCVTDCFLQGIILDKSCTVTQGYNQKGTAGIVGCVTTPNDDASHSVYIISCGNEANVSSSGCTTAGIVGDVLNDNYNNNVQVNIRNCYNTGNIVCGYDDGATIVAFARTNTVIDNTWNSGTINKYKTYNSAKYPFAGTYYSTGSITNCFDVNTDQVDGTKIKQITANDLCYGSLCKTLSGNVNGALFLLGYLYWSQDIANDSYPFPENRAAGLHYTRDMANQWGTICLPYDVTIVADSLYDFYAISSVNSDEITLTKMTGTLAAGTPVVIRRNTEATGIDIPAASSSSFVTAPVAGSSANGLTLTGTLASKEITNEDGYIIAGNNFWNIADIKGENKVYCNAFRAYLAGTLSSGAKTLSIGIGDDETDGIDDILDVLNGSNGSNGSNDSNGLNGEIYDLNGRRLNDLQPGINIVKYNNGVTKKVIIK